MPKRIVPAKVLTNKKRRLDLDRRTAQREALALLDQVPGSFHTAEERDACLERIAEGARPRVRAILLALVRLSRSSIKTAMRHAAMAWTYDELKAQMNLAYPPGSATAAYAEQFARRLASLNQAMQQAAQVACGVTPPPSHRSGESDIPPR